MIRSVLSFLSKHWLRISRSLLHGVIRSGPLIPVKAKLNTVKPVSYTHLVGDTIIDTNGEMFMVTKDYSSGSTVSIKYINGLIDYMTVEEFDAIFAENK